MGQILIRQLDDAVLASLRARAKRNERSLEAEARLLLTNAVIFDVAQLVSFRAKLAKGRKFDDGAMLVREDRESR